MTLVPLPKNSLTTSLRVQTETQVESWQSKPQPELQQQSSWVRGEAEALTKHLARSKAAADRQNALAPIAQRPVKPYQKTLFQTIGVLVGMVTMSAGTQLLTARLGALSLPAAMGLGGVLSWVADGTTSRAHTNKRRQQMALAGLQAQHQSSLDRPPVNELGAADHQARMALMGQVEAESLSRRFPTNGAISMVCYGAEYAATLWITSQLGLPGGLLVEGVVSLLPIGVQMGLAVAEGETCDLPEVATEVAQQYASVPQELLSADPEMAALEAHHIAQLDLRLNFFPDGDPAHPHYNLGMALAKGDEQFHTQRQRRLEIEGVEAVKARKAAHEAEIQELPERFSHTGMNLTQQQMDKLRESWVMQEAQRLQQKHEADQQVIFEEYTLKIQQCRQGIAAAQAQFEEAHFEEARRSGFDQDFPQAS